MQSQEYIVDRRDSLHDGSCCVQASFLDRSEVTSIVMLSAAGSMLASGSYDELCARGLIDGSGPVLPTTGERLRPAEKTLLLSPDLPRLHTRRITQHPAEQEDAIPFSSTSLHSRARHASFHLPSNDDRSQSTFSLDETRRTGRDRALTFAFLSSEETLNGLNDPAASHEQSLLEPTESESKAQGVLKWDVIKL